MNGAWLESSATQPTVTAVTGQGWRGAKRLGLALLLLTSSAGCAASHLDGNPWATVKTTGPGQPEAIGLASAGCVRGAVQLPLDGPGYHVMRPSRERFYGHPNLVEFVETLGQQVQQHHLGSLLVGDLGQPRGGPTRSMHRSHQSGLDVDIWFWLPNNLKSRTLSSAERERWSAPSVLNSDWQALDRELWTPRHTQLLRITAKHPEVNRIFVHPTIKRELCRSEKDRDWLRKIRPWWGHDDHLHVRLRCPAGDRQCISQEPLPPGDGCDASLAWWFSDAAKLRPPTGSSEPPPLPKLPAACIELIKES